MIRRIRLHILVLHMIALGKNYCIFYATHGVALHFVFGGGVVQVLSVYSCSFAHSGLINSTTQTSQPALFKPNTMVLERGFV